MAIAREEGTSSVGDHLQISPLGTFSRHFASVQSGQISNGNDSCSECVRVRRAGRLLQIRPPPGVLFAWPASSRAFAEAMIRVPIFTVAVLGWSPPRQLHP